MLVGIIHWYSTILSSHNSLSFIIHNLQGDEVAVVSMGTLVLKHIVIHLNKHNGAHLGTHRNSGGLINLDEPGIDTLW